MPDLTLLEDRIEILMKESSDAREARVQASSAEMATREAAGTAFVLAAERMQTEVVLPRVEALVRRFPQATVNHVSTVEGVQVRCVFPRSDRFPATVTLTVGLLHHRDGGVVSVFHSVDVVPMLVPFDRGGHLDLEIQTAERGDSDEQVAAYLDDALIGFLRHFLSLETDPQYQRASTTIDPVCRMAVTAASAAASSEHARTRFYFCSTGCRDKFGEDPDSYLRPGVQLRG